MGTSKKTRSSSSQRKARPAKTATSTEHQAVSRAKPQAKNPSQLSSEHASSKTDAAQRDTSQKIKKETEARSPADKASAEAKQVWIPEQIRTLADDILDMVDAFGHARFSRLIATLRFMLPQQGIPAIYASPCIDESKRYVAVVRKKLVRVKSPAALATNEDTHLAAENTAAKKKNAKTGKTEKEPGPQPKAGHASLFSRIGASLRSHFKKKYTTKKIEVVKAYIIYEEDDPKLARLKKKAQKRPPEIVPVKASPYFDISTQDIEQWVHMLAEQGLIEVHFPINIFADIVLRKRTRTDKKKEIKGANLTATNKNMLQEYLVHRDDVTSKIIIWDVSTENVGIYELITSTLGAGTEAVLTSIGQEITNQIKIQAEDITDPKKLFGLREVFRDAASSLLRELYRPLDEKTFEYLTGTLVHRLYGLGSLEIIIGDDNLEEIAINGSDQAISVYHRRYGWLKTNRFISTELDIYNLSAHIGRKVGQQINSLNPIMDAHLLTGDRVASTIFPVSTAGNTITIRRFSRNPWTLVHFLSDEVHLFSRDIAALIWLCMQYELNILVAGGTASGKTSVLNILSSMIAPQNRIISIEDTREIQLPLALRWNWVPLSSKQPNPEGRGAVTMLDLIIAALRMRPDRVIVGEIRRSEQAQALFEAMHTGHSVYATIHADTASQVIDRLMQKPMSVPETELEALHLIVIQYRDRRTGRRRTREVVEVIPAKDGVSLNYLYRWQPRTDRFEKVNDSIRIYEEISLHTGMTPQEIEIDLRKKEHILDWMQKEGVFDINMIGEVFRFYYKNPEWLYQESLKKTVREVLADTKTQKFTFTDLRERALHYKKTPKEELIEQFYKQFEVYTDEHWLAFIRTLDLSDAKINDLLYKVKQEFKKT